MDALEFLLWAFGILLVGPPAVVIGIPSLTAIIIAWRMDK